MGIESVLCMYINYGYEITAAGYLPESMSPCPPHRLGDPKLLTVLTVMFSNTIILSSIKRLLRYLLNRIILSLD